VIHVYQKTIEGTRCDTGFDNHVDMLPFSWDS